MKIVDNFMFHNEFDILEMRLAILYDQVDRFVIVEGNHTHSGQYKGFQLEQQLDRYKPWIDKIVYVKADGGTSSHSWTNESRQREYMALGWEDLNDSDIIMISDLDEIIRPEAVDFIKKTDYSWYGLYMPAFYFKLNYLDTKPDWHYKVWGRVYRGYKGRPSQMRYMNAGEISGKHIKLHHAGWHFGWLGDDEFVKTKLRSFAHTEWNRPDIVENIDIDRHINEGRDHVRPENITWVKVDIDEYYPTYILNNQEKYSKYILPNIGKSVRDYWPNKILETEN